MLKGIHRFTNVCRFHLLDVLPLVATYNLQRIALLLNLINKHIHAKEYWSHLQTPAHERAAWDHFQLWSANGIQCIQVRGQKMLFISSLFHRKFSVLFVTEIKSKVDKQLEGEFFSRSLYAMVYLTFRRICLFSVKITASSDSQLIAVCLFDLIASILSEIELIIRKWKLFCQMYYLFSL